MIDVIHCHHHRHHYRHHDVIIFIIIIIVVTIVICWSHSVGHFAPQIGETTNQIKRWFLMKIENRTNWVPRKKSLSRETKSSTHNWRRVVNRTQATSVEGEC